MRILWPAVAVTVAWVAVAPPVEAAPDPKKEALKLISQGDALFRKGDYEGALAKYWKAYEAFPSPKILYPIAKTEEQLGRYLEAIGHYEQLLKEAGTELSGEVRSDAEHRIEEIEKKIAIVSFEVRPDGTSISVDDVELGQAPLDHSVRLMPGAHKYSFSREGHKPLEMAVELSAGDRPAETIQLVKIRQETIDEPPPDLDPAHEKKRKGPSVPTNPRRGMLIGGIVVTSGLAVAATVTGLLAVSAYGTFTDASKPLQEREDAGDSGETLALATDLLLAGTAVAGAYTIYYYYKVYKPAGAAARERRPRPAADDEPPPPDIGGEVSTVITPWIGPSAGGITVMGSF